LRQAGEFQKSPAHLALELEPDQKQVSDQGSPDLDEHSILGSAVKGFDLQVLLDPLEKEFDLPAAAVEFGYLQGRQVQAVGQKDVFLAGLRVPIVDAAQAFRVTGLPLRGTQPDNLVGQDRAGSRPALDHLIAGVGLEPGHEPDAGLVQAIKPGIIQISPVKDQQIVRLEVQVLDSPAVMGLAVGDQDALGQHPGQNGVEFNGPLAGPEFGPGKDAGAEVDGSGIDDFDIRRLLRLGGQFGAEPLVELIVGLFKDDGGALLIGVGQGGALHHGKAQVVALADLPVDAEHQVPQTFAGTPLAEEHGSQVRPIGELPGVWPPPGVAVHQVVENMSRYEL
jgi:hypothetical protein